MISEALESTAFYFLAGIGYVAFSLMYIVLKKMGNLDMLPIWVRIIVLIAIPFVAIVFTGYAEG